MPSVSAYNLWYLLERGHVQGVTSLDTVPLLGMTRHAVGLVLSYVTLAIALWRLERGVSVGLAGTLFSLGVFAFATDMHERYLLPAVVLGAMTNAGAPLLWWPYAILSATFFVNLVTVAPFTSLLGINLIATTDTSAVTRVLKWLALGAAAINVGAVLWLSRATDAAHTNHGRGLRRLWGMWLQVRFRLTQRHRHQRLVVEQVAGRPIVVMPEVLNPKLFRTGEFLVEQLEELHIAATTRVLDMGTGSGVAAVAAAERSEHVTAVDINEAAVRCARVNALARGVDGRMETLCGDLFAPVAGREFDLVLFNPPFLRGTPASAFDRALRAGDVLDRFAAELPGYLAAGGFALVVISSDADIESFLDRTRANGLDVTLLASRDLINEVLYAYRLANASRGRPA